MLLVKNGITPIRIAVILKVPVELVTSWLARPVAVEDEDEPDPYHIYLYNALDVSPDWCDEFEL